LKKSAGFVQKASTKRVKVIENENDALVDMNESGAEHAAAVNSSTCSTPRAGGRPSDWPPNQQPSTAGSADSTVNTEGASGPAGAPVPEVNYVIAAAPAVSFMGELMNGSAAPVSHVRNDVFPLSIDDSVATSLSCPVAQLSTLTYVDVQVKCNAKWTIYINCSLSRYWGTDFCDKIRVVGWI